MSAGALARAEAPRESGSELAALLAGCLGCDEGLAVTLARGARVRAYAPHAIIIEGDAENQDVHLLAAGHARLVASSLDGRLVVIEDYAAGDLMGLTGLFGWDGAPTQVCAVVTSRTGAFAAHAFVALMSTQAGVALAVSRLLVARLAAANRRAAENATLSAPGRIHAELLRRARAGGGGAIRPMPVLAEMALALQTTRETVSRAISALEKRGIVKRADDALLIVAPHRLEELVY